MTAAHSADFPRDAVEACLHRISTSPPFSRSPRLRAFLRFTVEALLEGRAAELKERTIASEVYRRSAAYDPRHDPIVRSEAHRLRARLDTYYARDGALDPIVIRLPKGGYVPELRPNPHASRSGDGRGALLGTERTAPPQAASGRATAARAHDAFVKGRHSVIEYANTLEPRHLERARQRLCSALAWEPEHVGALTELAYLELLRLYPPRGETAQVLATARAYLERARALAPSHARSLYLLGHVEGSAMQPREALRLTESAVALDPEDPEGRIMLAVRYASLGFWESAVAACDVALSMDPLWEAARPVRIYMLTRMGSLEAARAAIDELARVGTSPTELAFARFDLRIAEGAIPLAEATLASPESTFAARSDLEDRRALAGALATALLGRMGEARATLDARRDDGPRMWDHAIRLALATGEGDLARDLLTGNPFNGHYRWLATDELVRPWLRQPQWRALAEQLHATWLRDLEEIGPRLPARPPALPDPAHLW